jgi:putative colanic acid biosynthesis acetyltransferase WcaF
MKPRNQKTAYDSPWPIWVPLGVFFWKLSWFFLCSWTPKFLNPWRLIITRVFGAEIHGTPFVHQRAIIQMPWHLTMHDRACLGERANAYSLGRIEIMERATIAQEAYLCTGTHDINDKSFQLLTKKISIGSNAFVGARAMILPGVSVGVNAVVGAQAVVTRNVQENEIVAGNPARVIGNRTE